MLTSVHTDTPHQWSTPAGLVACGWGLTLLAVLWWSTATDAVDGLFIGVVVLALVAVSAYGSILRPRLRADTTGITVRTLNGTKHWPWHQVLVRVRSTRRLGLTTEALELEVPEQDTGGGLIVLTKLDLGTDVTEVAEHLDQLRP